MKMQPELSIILVNYNGLKDTCECIDSIRQHITLFYELIVVDNGSRDDESISLKNQYPEIICLRSDKNSGFAGGNNLGIKHSNGKYLLLLNNDTLIQDDSLIYLIQKLDSNPQIGGVSPKIKFTFSPQAIQYAGYTRLSKITLRNRPIGFGEIDAGQYDRSIKTPYLHGAAMMVKREIFQKAGLMPEIYFLYYEELDWSVRIRQAGYQLYYEPRCTVFHKESQSTGQQSPLRCYYLTRNRLLYASRNRQGINRFLSVCYQLTVVFLRNSISFLLHGKFALMKATLSGIVDFFLLKHKKD